MDRSLCRVTGQHCSRVVSRGSDRFFIAGSRVLRALHVGFRRGEHAVRRRTLLGRNSTSRSCGHSPAPTSGVVAKRTVRCSFLGLVVRKIERTSPRRIRTQAERIDIFPSLPKPNHARCVQAFSQLRRTNCISSATRATCRVARRRIRYHGAVSTQHFDEDDYALTILESGWSPRSYHAAWKYSRHSLDFVHRTRRSVGAYRARFLAHTRVSRACSTKSCPSTELAYGPR